MSHFLLVRKTDKPAASPTRVSSPFMAPVPALRSLPRETWSSLEQE